MTYWLAHVVLIQTHVNERSSEHTGLTGMPREEIVRRALVRKEIPQWRLAVWQLRYWQRAARRSPAERVQIFNDRAGLFVTVSQTRQRTLEHPALTSDNHNYRSLHPAATRPGSSG
jgi:hypothetical protein